MEIRAPRNLRLNYITMLCTQFCPHDIIHFGAINNTAEYTSMHTSKYAHKMLLSTHPNMISSMLSMPFNYIFQACLTLCFQVNSQEACKYTPSMVPGIPPGIFSSTLLSVLSTKLLIAHDDILANIYALI